MGYGFSCGYCDESIDTRFNDADNATLFADLLGWCLTYGHTDSWGGTAHYTCPNCANGSAARVHLSDRPWLLVTGLPADEQRASV